MSIPVTDLSVYKYMLSDVTLTAPGWTEPYVIEQGKITSVSIVNNYEGAIIPQLSLEAVVPYKTYYEILASSKNLEATFTISSTIGGDTSGSGEQTPLAAYNNEYAKVKMRATNQGYVHSRDVVETQMDITGDTSTSESMDMQIKLFLYDSDKLIKYRRNKSFVINGNMNDAIYEMLSSRGVDNIVFTPTMEVEQATYAIPYGDLGQNLEDLNHHYGIYDYKYLFFMGLDRTYLISKGNLGNDLEYGELGTVNVYVEPYDSETPNIYAGCYRDEINKLYVLGTMDAKIDDVDTLADYAYGGKITSVVAGTKNKYIDTVGTYDVEKSYLINNKKEHTQFIHELHESKRMLMVNFKNIDLSIITPNKKYMVLANEKFYDQDYEISGEYRLANSSIALVNDGTGAFNATVSLSLLKIN